MSRTALKSPLTSISQGLVSFVLLGLLAGCASVFDEPGELPTKPTKPVEEVVKETTKPVETAVAENNDPETFVKPPSANYNNPDAYVLGNGDTIGILVFDEQDLTMDAQIGDSGEINYSYLGALKVSGKTPEQLEREITSALKEGYLVNPSVNVSIKQYRPFFINGEVKSPGGYPYQPGLTLEKAITLAGGLTDRASSRRMFVIRADQVDEGKQRIRMESDVAPGDVIEINEGFF